MGLVVSPAGQTGSPYLKIWTVCLFEDYLSVCTYIVAPSESDEGSVNVANELAYYQRQAGAE